MSAIVRNAAQAWDDITTAAGKGSEALFNARGPSENEKKSKPHRDFREAHHGHKPHAGLDPSRASTGVVWTTERAYEHGFLENPKEWANLGQGAPEVEDGN
ncbi:hypothetical protein KC368_g3652 [Hortaea werneckii]|nr:hypothetical protein KC368_g3652 [Hortaea werneckii]